MPYKITAYTKRQAKKLGVEVKLSKTKGKKIDVFKKGKKVASVIYATLDGVPVSRLC